jgi:uncharacterized protein with HEPN domain
MPHDEQAKSYLWDIREAAREIEDFMRGVKFHEFENDKKLRYAVERQLHVIGEAANHIAPQFRSKHPEINWKRLIELRNVIAHEYGETLMNRIWLGATDGLSELIETLNGLLEEEE